MAVEDFLDVLHKFVEDFDDVSVLQLRNRMSPLMHQIRQLANMFAIHPDSKTSNTRLSDSYLNCVAFSSTRSVRR